jgi:hypothetical protein
MCNLAASTKGARYTFLWLFHGKTGGPANNARRELAVLLPGMRTVDRVKTPQAQGVPPFSREPRGFGEHEHHRRRQHCPLPTRASFTKMPC